MLALSQFTFRLCSQDQADEFGMAEMSKVELASGVVHTVPDDLAHSLMCDDMALGYWQEITPLARNEWICWIIDAKKADTRQRRIERMCNDLKQGKRRPCCWPGCSHREKNGN